MDISLSYQIFQIFASLVLGAVLGFFYDILKAVRLRLTKRWITHLTDGIFWLVFSAAIIIFSLSTGGEQRVFILIFTFLGGMLYYFTLSPAALFVCCLITDAVCYILYCIGRPAVYLGKLIKKCFAFLKKVFHFLHKWYKIDKPKYVNQPAQEKGVPNETKGFRYSY